MKIAVIMPTYKAHKTIARALGSILQQTIIDQIHTYIVVDADGEDYTYLHDQFGKQMKITILEAEENGGCGVARQIGIDNSTEPYIMFLDTDDTFAGAFALQTILNHIESNEHYIAVSNSFLEQTKGGGFVLHQQDFLWMHGKIYRRSFLDKYGIRFNETRANEDMGFNYKIKLLQNPLEQVMFAKEVVHYWHWNDNSIVRADNQLYKHTASIDGTVKNLIDIYKRFKDAPDFERKLAEMMFEAFVGQYYTYIALWEHYPKSREHIKKWHTIFYHEVIANLKDEYRHHINRYFANITSQRLGEINGIIPAMTFGQYEGMLRDGEKG